MKKRLLNHLFTALTAISGTITILDAIPRYKTLFIFLFGVGIGYYICHLLHYRRPKDPFLEGLLGDK